MVEGVSREGDAAFPKIKSRVPPSPPEDPGMDGITDKGLRVIDDADLTRSKYHKLKKAGSILLDKFHSLKGKAETALGVGTALVDQGRAVNEISQVFFAPCRVLNKILTPLRFLSWTAAPFVAANFVSHGVDFFTTPGLGKIYPVMNSIVDVGIAAEMAANAGYLLQDLGIAAAQNVGVWATPLSGVAIGLQSVAIAINGWGLAEVSNALRKLNKAMNENEEGMGYEKAVHFLTKEPETKLERFRAKFFKVLSAKQESKLVRIHEKAMSGEDGIKEKDVKKALDAIKHRFHLKQFAYGLAIVAAVAGIIGVAILVFGPTPLSPLGWAFVGLSATVSITLVGLNIYASKVLTYRLNRIDPEIASPSKPPFHKRVFKLLRTKIIKRADGSTEKILVQE